MRNRIIISESDRQHILSMYGLLTEEEKDFIINVKLIDKETKEPVGFQTIEIKDGDGNRVDVAMPDVTGIHKFEVKLNTEKTYFIFIAARNGYKETKKPIDNVNTNQDITIELEMKEKVKGLKEMNLSTSSIFSFNLENIKDNYGEELNGYNIEVYSDKNETPFYENKNTNKKSYDFLNNGIEISEILKNKEGVQYNKNNEFFRDKKIKIVISKVNYNPFIINNVKLNISGSIKLLKDKNVIKPNTDDDESITSKIERSENQTSNIKNINAELTKIEYSKTFIVKSKKEKIVGALIKGDGNDYKGETNSEGKLEIKFNIKDNNKDLSFYISKEGYDRKYITITVGDEDKIERINLIKKGEEGDISGDEILDFKNTFRTIVGRAKSKISNDESLRLAKINAIKEFIGKNKKYKDLESLLSDRNPDMPYNLGYYRDKNKRKNKNEEFYNILILKKSDIKKYLNNLAQSENKKIKQDFKSINFETLDLISSIDEAYRYDQELFIVLGLKDDEDTKKLINKINNNEISNKIGVGDGDKYLPIFIPVDRKNKNYNKLSELVSFNDYPRVIILKPKNFKEVEVINNDFEV